MDDFEVCPVGTLHNLAELERYIAYLEGLIEHDRDVMIRRLEDTAWIDADQERRNGVDRV